MRGERKRLIVMINVSYVDVIQLIVLVHLSVIRGKLGSVVGFLLVLELADV
jgi:hypothetical protein